MPLLLVTAEVLADVVIGIFLLYEPTGYEIQCKVDDFINCISYLCAIGLALIACHRRFSGVEGIKLLLSGVRKRDGAPGALRRRRSGGNGRMRAVRKGGFIQSIVRE